MTIKEIGYSVLLGIAIIGALFAIWNAVGTPSATESEPEIRYVYATPYHEPTIAMTAGRVEPTQYTKIWCYVAASFYVYDSNGAYLGSDSSNNEVTMPYTEYDWYDDSATVYDVVDAMGFPYTSIETVSEKSSYPADNKYEYQGQYIIYCDDGRVTMALTCSGTRY